MTASAKPRSPRLSFLSGFVAAPTLALLGLALIARYLPDRSFFQVVGRVADSMIPHLLVAVLVLSLVIAALGAWRIALLILFGALATGGLHGWNHYQRTLPFAPEARVDLSVLWFNMLNENWMPPGDISAALIASGADVVVLGEANRMQNQTQVLREVFPHQMVCEPWCQVIVLSKFPLENAIRDRLSIVSPGRFVKADVVTPAGPITLVGAHLVKPWFDHLAYDEVHELSYHIEVTEGPVVLVGDMNAAPWARRMVHMQRDTKLKFAQVPPATWPTRAGAFGIPIDHVMVGNGAQMVSLQAWGDDGLGSNHFGLLAQLSLPQAAAQSSDN